MAANEYGRFLEDSFLLDLGISLEATFERPPIQDIHQQREWWNLYRFERYGTKNPDFGPDYVVVPLTRGYFSVVSLRLANRILSDPWNARIQTNEQGDIVGLYAGRNPNKRERKRGAPSTILLHRFIKGCVFAGKKAVVDHATGHGLDNRDCNLNVTSQTYNLGNSGPRVRTRDQLPRGVEPIRNRNKDGEERVTGYRARIKSGGKRISSPVYNCPERASRWYSKAHALIFPVSTNWSGVGDVEPLQFPQPASDWVPF